MTSLGFLRIACLFFAQMDKTGVSVPEKWSEIQVIDSETNRGIPLVELETTNNIVFVTDNAGRIALGDPDLLDREVHFSVRSHGYKVIKDGLGVEGIKVRPKVGEIVTISLQRKMPAERLCRLTGEGRFRDSILLGKPVPDFAKIHQGQVSGQDSVQAILYKGKIRWFWGDTLRLSYPLGLFHTAGATSAVPSPDFNPNDGIPFQYFVGADGFARAMMPYTKKSSVLVWVFSLCVVPDAKGQERLVTHYTVRKDLTTEYEHGVAVYNDEKDIFEAVVVLPQAEKWRYPTGHPIPWEKDGKKWLLMGSPNPNVRVPATLEAVLDPRQYEAFTCAEGLKNNKPTGPLLDEKGKPVWRWTPDLPPVDSATEAKWVKEKKINPDDARFCPGDLSGKEKERIILHSGSVRWNGFRKRWIVLAGQLMGTPSFLGEVWYAEADSPLGPFSRAVRVASHDKQTFYNVCHHPFLDREEGRFVHFEGTYTNEFSGNPWKTPRYNYNQILYRLKLDDPSLKAAWKE